MRLQLALYEAFAKLNPVLCQWQPDRTTLTAVFAKLEAGQKAPTHAHPTCLGGQLTLSIRAETEHGALVHLRGSQLPSKNRRGFSTVIWWMSWSEAPSSLRRGSTRREMNT
jgi:hypothetical protein